MALPVEPTGDIGGQPTRAFPMEPLHGQPSKVPPGTIFRSGPFHYSYDVGYCCASQIGRAPLYPCAYWKNITILILI